MALIRRVALASNGAPSTPPQVHDRHATHHGAPPAIRVVTARHGAILITMSAVLCFQKGGSYLAIYLWGFMFVLSLVMMTLYPVLIAHFFNNFTPLPRGPLREKIEALALSLKFP